MQLGDIYFWETNKAIGHDSRPKYHLFIREPDWNFDHTFLFINKADYGGDFPISNKDYPFFPLETSYVDLGSSVGYTDDELKSANPTHKGTLTKPHLQGIYNSILAGGKMTRGEEKFVCEALRHAF